MIKALVRSLLISLAICLPLFFCLVYLTDEIIPKKVEYHKETFENVVRRDCNDLEWLAYNECIAMTYNVMCYLKNKPDESCLRANEIKRKDCVLDFYPSNN